MSLLYIALLSMLPVAELRGGIPLGLSSGLNPIFVYFYCVFFNALVVPFVFFFLDHIHKQLVNVRLYNNVFNNVLQRARRNSERTVKSFGYLGLAIFVAVPLPFTGAYTGAIAAWFFNMRGKKAYAALIGGVAAAGIIVTLAYLTGAEILKVFINAP